MFHSSFTVVSQCRVLINYVLVWRLKVDFQQSYSSCPLKWRSLDCITDVTGIMDGLAVVLYVLNDERGRQERRGGGGGCIVQNVPSGFT